MSGEEDGEDTRGGDGDPQERTAIGWLVEDERRERDDPEARGALKENGIGRGRYHHRVKIQADHDSEGHHGGDHGGNKHPLAKWDHGE